MSKIILEFTNDEARILAGCLRDIQEELDDNELNSRIGTEKREIEELRLRIKEAMQLAKS